MMPLFVLVVSLILALFGMFINIIVIVAFIRQKELRVPHNFYIISLCLTDFCTAGLYFPITITRMVHWDSGWSFWSNWCNVWLCGSFLFLIASLWAIGGIALERWQAIAKPWIYANKNKSLFAGVIIAISWALALVESFTLVFLTGNYNNNHNKEDDEINPFEMNPLNISLSENMTSSDNYITIYTTENINLISSEAPYLSTNTTDVVSLTTLVCHMNSTLVCHMNSSKTVGMVSFLIGFVLPYLAVICLYSRVWLLMRRRVHNAPRKTGAATSKATVASDSQGALPSLPSWATAAARLAAATVKRDANLNGSSTDINAEPEGANCDQENVDGERPKVTESKSQINVKHATNTLDNWPFKVNTSSDNSMPRNMSDVNYHANITENTETYHPRRKSIASGYESLSVSMLMPGALATRRKSVPMTSDEPIKDYCTILTTVADSVDEGSHHTHPPLQQQRSNNLVDEADLVLHRFVGIRLHRWRHLANKDMTTIRMIGIILAAFFICWTPLIMLHIYHLYHTVSDILYLALESLSCLNASVNPILYVAFNTHFRTAIMKMFKYKK